jgi:bifunctional non-homologous end joining protein LigD
VYYAFDLLHLDGFNARAAPLIERKRVLEAFIRETATAVPAVIYSEHFEDGADLYAIACGLAHPANGTTTTWTCPPLASWSARSFLCRHAALLGTRRTSNTLTCITGSGPRSGAGG